MRKIVTIVGIGVIIAFLFIIFARKNTNNGNIIFQHDQPSWENYETIVMEIEEREYTLLVADTPEKNQKGLMFVRKPINGFDGMVFRFSDEQNRTFWNKNTFLDLKLYWMIHGEVIGTSDLPLIEKSNDIVTVSSPGPVDTVVEIIR